MPVRACLARPLFTGTARLVLTLAMVVKALTRNSACLGPSFASGRTDEFLQLMHGNVDTLLTPPVLCVTLAHAHSRYHVGLIDLLGKCAKTCDKVPQPSIALCSLQDEVHQNDLTVCVLRSLVPRSHVLAVLSCLGLFHFEPTSHQTCP